MQIRVAQQLEHIITVSEMSREHVQELFQVLEEKLSVIYNGIDTDLFSPSENVQRTGNMILIIMSRDTLVKGLLYLLEAFAIVRQNMT